MGNDLYRVMEQQDQIWNLGFLIQFSVFFILCIMGVFLLQLGLIFRRLRIGRKYCRKIESSINLWFKFLRKIVQTGVVQVRILWQYFCGGFLVGRVVQVYEDDRLIFVIYMDVEVYGVVIYELFVLEYLIFKINLNQVRSFFLGSRKVEGGFLSFQYFFWFKC